MAKTFKIVQKCKNIKTKNAYTVLTGLFKKFDEEKMKIAGDSFKGDILLIKKNKMITFTFASNDWEKGTMPTVVTISFNEAEAGTMLELFHSNVDDNYVDALKPMWKVALKAVEKGA